MVDYWCARRRPRRGQWNEASLPVPDNVTNAVVRSSPPKQMLVVTRSGMGTSLASAPSAECTVIPPVIIVATQTLPSGEKDGSPFFYRV